MIASVDITNFEIHSFLQLKFEDGINILYGDSNRGKSSIERAIKWVLFNENISGFRKLDTKQTSVLIRLKSKYEIERVRSATINRYILREPNKNEIELNAVGRSGVPEEIKKIIGIEPVFIGDEEVYINSYPQIALPFLFGTKGVKSDRAKLFNQLTGNDLLDKLFSQFNKDLLVMNRNLRENKERLIIQEQELTTKEKEKDILQYRYDKLKNLFKKIEDDQKKYDKLLELLSLQEQNESSLKDINTQISNTKYIEPIELEQLTSKTLDYNKKKSLLDTLNLNNNTLIGIDTELSKLTLVEGEIIEQTRQKIDRSTCLNTLLEKLEINDAILQKTLQHISCNEAIDIGDLNEKMERYIQLEKHLTMLNKNDILLGELKIQEQENNKLLVDSLEDLKKLYEDMGTCPTCHREMTEECLKGMIN